MKAVQRLVMQESWGQPDEAAEYRAVLAESDDTKD
jgi:hypothetical protein